MSVNSYIAAGTNPGAGVPQMRFNQQQANRNAYVQDRAFEESNRRYELESAKQATAAQAAYGQETLAILSKLPNEQRKAAFLARAQEAASRPDIGLPPNFNPEEAFARISAQLPPYQPSGVGTEEAFFNRLTEGLTEEEKRKARLVELRLAPGAVGNSDMTLAGGGAGIPSASEVGAAAGTVAGGRKAGEQAIAMSGDFMEQVPQVRKSISNIETGIQALDDGANSGYVYNMLPSIRQASIELENAANRMGLDVIGSVTFGALSEGELKLAMNTAMPRNLPPKELREWLVKRKDAQEKLVRELQQAAIFLGTPGNTPAMWMEQNTTQAAKAPKKGDVVDGWMFMGGDPAKRENWRKE